MRLILALSIMCFLNLSLDAQVSDKSFIAKDHLKWLNKEIQVLESNLAVANQDLSTKNLKASRTPNKLITNSIERIGEHFPAIAEKLEFYKTDIADTQYLDGIVGDRKYQKHKNKKLLQEVTMTESDLSTLKMHTNKVAQLVKQIDSNKSQFHPTSDLADANLKFANELFNTVKDFNTILQEGIISTK